MIDMEYIRGFYPPYIAQNANLQKHMLKEYVELLALEWIARSPYAAKLVFIGGTNLRLIQGIDRFSEDLDFDCKGLSEENFRQMSDELVKYLQQHGLKAELRNKENTVLRAFSAEPMVDTRQAVSTAKTSPTIPTGKRFSTMVR